MKKFLVPLFFALLFSCSSDGFKSDIAASAQKNADCYVNGKYIQNISKSLCEEIGGSTTAPPGGTISSSSDEEISSSSSEAVSGSSSSSEAVSGSSSSGSTVSSSSSGGAVSSSSSGGAVSSSSSDGAASSSSSETPSSSSFSSSSEAPPTWSGCNIPSYVGRNEPIANLKFISIENNNGHCGTITYRLSAQGQSAINLNYSSSAIGTSPDLTIYASTTCTGGITLSSTSCRKQVTVADYVKFSEPNTDYYIKVGKTVVEVGGVPVTNNKFGCQARDNSNDPSPNPFRGMTSFILNGESVTGSMTVSDGWWIKTAITSNRMLFESNNTEGTFDGANATLGSYRCQIE